MEALDPRFSIFTVENGRTFGLLIKRRNGATAEHFYFFEVGPCGLGPTSGILRLCGKNCFPISIQRDEAAIYRLLTGYARFVAQSPVAAAPVPITDCTDKSIAFGRILDHFFAQLRPKQSPLRDVLGDSKTFTQCILSRERGRDTVVGRAETFGVIASDALDARGPAGYLTSAQQVLRVGEGLAPVWFRRSGPIAIDFATNHAYRPEVIMDTVHRHIQNNPITVLEGDAATGKSVIARMLAYDLLSAHTCPVTMFHCAHTRRLDPSRLAQEIMLSQGLVIVEDIHLLPREIQIACTRLTQGISAHILFTTRPSLHDFTESHTFDITTLPTVHLARQDTRALVHHYARALPQLQWPERIIETIAAASHSHLWLLAHTLLGYTQSDGHGSPATWQHAGIVQDLSDLNNCGDIHHEAYPDIMVALSPLSMAELPTDELFLIDTLGFPRDAMRSLARRGDVLSECEDNGHTSYRVPHSALGQAYWMHGSSYRVRHRWPDWENWIYNYSVSGATNGLTALLNARPPDATLTNPTPRRMNRLLRDRRRPIAILSEGSLYALSSWLGYERLRTPRTALFLAEIANKMQAGAQLWEEVSCFREMCMADERATMLALGRDYVFHLVERIVALDDLDRILQYLGDVLVCKSTRRQILSGGVDLGHIVTLMNSSKVLTGIGHCLRSFYKWNTRLGHSLWQRINTRQLANRVTHHADVADAWGCLEEVGKASHSMWGELRQYVPASVLSRQLVQATTFGSMVDALVSLIAVDRSLAHAVWTAARDAVAGSLQSSQRSDCRLFQFALLATADHAIGEELFQMIDAGEVCNRIAREEALEYLAHSLAFMRQEKLPQLARAFSEHIPMSEVARRLSAVEDTRGVFCSFTSFSRGEVRAICEHLDIEAMARSIVLEGVDDYIVEGIRALQRSSHSTAGRLIAAIEDKDVRQEIRARVSKV